MALSGYIGGWSISGTRLSSGSLTNYIALDSGTSGVNYFIWAGDETAANAPFSITRTGYLHATGAHIEGYIEASSGSIGGWEIDNGDLKYLEQPYLIRLSGTAQDTYAMEIRDTRPGYQNHHFFYIERHGHVYSHSGATLRTINWGTTTNSITDTTHLVLLTSGGTYSLPDSYAEEGCELDIVVNPQSSGGVIPIISISSTGTIDFINNNSVTTGSTVTVLTGTYKAIYWGNSYWTLSKTC